ncbi:MAG: FKBP-type peptidyl-prolyl cis-trans isomerase [Pirellulales bacterium]
MRRVIFFLTTIGLGLTATFAQTPSKAPARPGSPTTKAPPAATSPAAKKPTPTAEEKTAADYQSKKSYAYGLDIARAIRADEMEFDLPALIKGLSDGLNNQKPTISETEYGELMTAITKEAREKTAAKLERTAEENKKAAEKFLAENSKQEGVVTLSGGVQYKILKEGEGRSPKPTESVQVHLKGMLLNGSQFFNSHSINEPSVFPVGRVIKGLKDAILEMKKGDKWMIYIPPDAAFGKEGNTPAAPGLPGVGPNEVVIYEVELLEIVAEVQE